MILKSFFGKTMQSEELAYSDFSIALSFAIIGSIAVTTYKFINNPERKKTGILFLNVRKLINLHLIWNTIRRLKKGSLFFVTRLIIIKSFLGTALTTVFGVNTRSKNSFMHLSACHVGNSFYTRCFLIYLFHDGISQNPSTN